MTKTKKPRKKNPQDTTFRNLNALKRRVTRLEEAVELLKSDWMPRVRALEEWTQRQIVVDSSPGWHPPPDCP